MSVLANKLRTAGRVIREQGVTGVLSVVKGRAGVITAASMEYARVAPPALALLARHGRPDMIINIVGGGFGDDMLCTAVFHELRCRGEQKIWLMAGHRPLHLHNPDAPVLVPPLARFDDAVEQLGVRVVRPWYTSYHPAFDRDDPMPEQHLISLMCQKAGITGSVALRPYLTLTDDETRRGVLRPRQVAIQSAGLDAKHAMRNKNWQLEGYQAVVSALTSTYDFVQVGSTQDPPLEGALDLRGKTSARETAAVLRGSLAFVGQVGFLMHLARAVDCRAVVVFGGRETPAQSGYSCNENLYAPVPCSPCWLLNVCPYDRMCLRMISAEQVIDALERQVARHGTPLEVASDTITPAMIERGVARYAQAVATHTLAWAALYETVPDAVDSSAGIRFRDTFTGAGTVSDGEQVVAEVNYRLHDVTDVAHEPALAGADPGKASPEERSIYGLLRSSQNEVFGAYVGAALTLRLADGRLLPLTVTKMLRRKQGPVHAVLVRSVGAVP